MNKNIVSLGIAAVIGLILVAAIVHFFRTQVMPRSSGNPSVEATMSNEQLSDEELINRYNAEHGQTIAGETLTPSANGYQPVVINTQSPTTGAPGRTGDPSGSVAQPTPNGCVAGVVQSITCNGDSCVVALDNGQQPVLPSAQANQYTVGVYASIDCYLPGGAP